MRNAVVQSVRGAFEYQGMGFFVEQLRVFDGNFCCRAKVFGTFEALCFFLCLEWWVQGAATGRSFEDHGRPLY